MMFGSTKCAMEYAERGEIHEWIQLFLRNEGENIALADGLLQKKRYYIGPVLTDISTFGIEEGAPSYLDKENDIAWFFHIVDKMKQSFGEEWDYPPLIVFYTNGKYEIADGRHRNEALRQLGIKHAHVVFWTDNEEDNKYIINLTSSEEYIIDCEI